MEPSSESPGLDAEVLLAFVLGKPREYLRTWPEKNVDEEHALHFESLLQRRANRQPVAHLTGRREFWSLELEVTTDTLIPRPETELLVERALQRIPADADSSALDLGTGSGAVALALARERRRCTITATEISLPALAVAEANARRLGLDNLRFVQSDWFAELGAELFDLIVSNPPYVTEDHPHLEGHDISFEPRIALVAGADGLDAIRHIAARAGAHSRDGAWLLLEHGDEQGDAVLEIMGAHGFTHRRTHADLAGRPRVTEGKSR